MANFELRILSEKDYPLWDEFVDKSSRGTLFHKSYWLKASGKAFTIYGYFKGGELFAGMPIACNTRLGIKSGFHPAITPYLGIIFKEQEAKYNSRLSSEKAASRDIAVRLKEDFHILDFKFSPGPVDLQPFIWEGFSVNVRYTYKINLEGDLENIFKSMEDKKRNTIKKAEKDGIHISRNNDFEQVWRLLEKTFARQNKVTNVKSVASRYDESLKARNQCQSFIALNQKEEPIGAVYMVWDNRRSYYVLGGYDAGISHQGGVALAIWEAIKFAKQELGLKEFDFDGSMLPRVEQFFRHFGGLLTPVYTTSWVNPYVGMMQLVRDEPRRAISRILHR